MTLLIELEDKDLVEEAQSIGHHRTETEAVETALRTYIEIRKRNQILTMFGTVEYDPDYDYKVQRQQS
ncbi:MAG: type II toxin-antitoxin system VapB family antitoxin [Aquificales bacterium]|nr:type II toxin-antitoxin system VapB family antitoxin [Aquificales bacterium]